MLLNNTRKLTFIFIFVTNCPVWTEEDDHDNKKALLARAPKEAKNQAEQSKINHLTKLTLQNKSTN